MGNAFYDTPRHFHFIYPTKLIVLLLYFISFRKFTKFVFYLSFTFALKVSFAFFLLTLLPLMFFNLIIDLIPHGAYRCLMNNV
ncbi:hypothetical protein BC829DRAFT_404236, partial [Chytridium lagenaria]